ncbi:MAG: cytochrome c3 family protein [Acidobacteria bacterium]|nr:cytochrome c3 family protein [Acidobacteriota bacterium]
MLVRIWLTLISMTALAAAQTPKAAASAPLPGSDDCAACHDSGRRTGKREAGVPPEFDAAALKASPHASLECKACHSDIKEVPHADKLEKPECGSCHPDQATMYEESLHGKALARGDRMAPVCSGCHGTHNVLRATAPRSPISTVEVPKLCGRCHQEGSPVSKTHAIPQSNILGNYVDSIHGEGLFKRGLTVTAVCTSCHTSHFVLPHTDKRSSISQGNIAKTCTKCHAQIEAVHQKVIRGELWEKQPHLIPACVDCHEPHKVRKVFYAQGMADRDCQKCHADPALKVVRDGKTVPLFVKHEQIAGSRHAKVACVQCHTSVKPSKTRPCDGITAKVDCSICHAQVVTQYQESTHGQLSAKGSADAPGCLDCHSGHGTQGKNDSNSPTFSRNVPNLCAKCHRSGQKAANRYNGKQEHILERYSESIHGRGLIQAGLTVTADCADCHTPHHELPSKDPRSTVNKANVAKTCAQCHRGIYETFTSSVHSSNVTRTGKELPSCSDCHSAHGIQRTDESNFRLHIMDQCGRCHKDITETYFETFHGKGSTLGDLKTAKCYDCHGAHDILPVTNDKSRLSRNNIVGTCGKCHPGSHRQFAGYLTHATHHDPKRYPFLFYTFWGMTTLLVGTLVVSGAHTALWLPRSLEYRRQLRARAAGDPEKYVRRFRPLHRNLHLMVITSFLGLAVTGMILKFSYAPWAVVIAKLVGGFEAAGFIHRVCAVLTFTYFGLHLWDVRKHKTNSGKGWLRMIFDREGMMFNRRDWKEFIGSLKWFVNRGPRPEYGRWTYWEKFDYFAVFWGVAVIGTTGLILWFPQFFTWVIPGWMVNVATTIHSDEALLAVCFIFVVHFFNTHFRPERFPIDTVIFTTGMPLEEFKHDRPREYQQLVESGKLEEYLMDAPQQRTVTIWRRIGFTALGIGMLVIVFIIYAVIFSYR